MAPDGRLPSTVSLRVFAAVARSGSTVRAAEAVGLTQSAVSKQVRLLEEALGCTLFERAPSGLLLTEEGRIYRPYAEAALEQLARGRRRLDERGFARRPVRLHMLAIVGERWLMARFPDFTANHPDIDVQFTHYVSENETEEPDIDIRHGDGHWPDHESSYLFGREMAFVCAPAFLDRHDGLVRPADVQKATLLQHFQMPAYWAEFTEAHGLRGAVPAHTIRYGYLSVIVKAAVAGLGFALVPRCFVRDEMRDGSLAELPHLRFDSGSGYWVTRRKGGKRRDVDVLADWLRKEAARFAAD
jgi:DNA-binding transcriptional LysR family regulator